MSDERSAPEAFYDAYGTDEWDRLAESIDGRLEYEFTLAEVTDAIPDSGRVLDAGGGAGRYAIWLAERGYEVDLLDVSRGQLDVAAEKLAEHGVADRVTLHHGSVDDLAFDADTFDATLCLGGPLSHLLDADDREQAVEELARVTRRDAPVLVSVMGLLGFVQLQALAGRNVRALPALLAHGDYDADLLDAHGYDNEFTATHFFRRAELRDLLAGAGLSVERVTGLEGLGSPLHDAGIRESVESLDDAERSAVVETFDRLRDDPAVADLSVHMLAICRS
ncbi:class I SAM-dependent methyltransferase [Halobaculum marinum]|uniref:Class I SAM-dependent methyltransferase n=1 Tax=Halobaculum marinum TaxID=3031996 RepID=A0ABD5WZ25_9EURY|nr:class I SAM-dependent methyltransferase [Halobaculum sp. DT55]